MTKLESVTVQSAVLVGIQAVPVEVTACWHGSRPFYVSGMPEPNRRESAVRVRSALQTCGVGLDSGQLAGIAVDVVGLPGPCSTQGLDLAIAFAVYGLVNGRDSFPPAYAELSLSGVVRAVRGSVAAGRLLGSRAIVGESYGGDCEFARTLKAAIEDDTESVDAAPWERKLSAGDFSDMHGLAEETIASVVEALCARRPILLVGPPGAGKTMLARRLVDLLPELTDDEKTEVSLITDAAGLGCFRQRPFRAPHHSCSPAGLIGGGSGCPRPGEASLATHGVLFLDEVTEFSKQTMELTKRAILDGGVTLVRAGGAVQLPTKPALVVLASNECSCGWAGSTRRCRCTPGDLAAYKARLDDAVEGLDPVVIHLPMIDLGALQAPSTTPTTAELRALIEDALKRSPLPRDLMGLE